MCQCRHPFWRRCTCAFIRQRSVRRRATGTQPARAVRQSPSSSLMMHDLVRPAVLSCCSPLHALARLEAPWAHVQHCSGLIICTPSAAARQGPAAASVVSSSGARNITAPPVTPPRVIAKHCTYAAELTSPITPPKHPPPPSCSATQAPVGASKAPWRARITHVTTRQHKAPLGVHVSRMAVLHTHTHTHAAGR